MPRECYKQSVELHQSAKLIAKASSNFVATHYRPKGSKQRLETSIVVEEGELYNQRSRTAVQESRTERNKKVKWPPTRNKTTWNGLTVMSMKLNKQHCEGMWVRNESHEDDYIPCGPGGRYGYG